MTNTKSDRVGKVTIWGGIGAAVIGAVLIGSVLMPGAASASKPGPHKVTLCHATDSYSNPYVSITVDVASVKFQGHNGHNGPVFYASIPKHTKWGDIIPAFNYGGMYVYGGKNTTSAGLAILNNGCKLPGQETTTTVEETTTTTEATTTSEVLASTTEQEFTTTTEGAATTEAATTTEAVRAEELARTGTDSGTMAAFGSILLATGGALVLAGRRRQALNN